MGDPGPAHDPHSGQHYGLDRPPMIRLREFRSGDLDALYAISLATGHEGGDASHLYKDAELMGHIYSAPYALLEPGLVLVAVDGDGDGDEVAGFAAGAVDTSQWEDVLEQDWWPALRRRYPDPDAASLASWTADQRRAAAIHHPERAPRDVVNAYPAHLHLNLLPSVQGQASDRCCCGLGLNSHQRAAQRRCMPASTAPTCERSDSGVKMASRT
jgi:hypothetical protein